MERAANEVSEVFEHGSDTRMFSLFSARMQDLDGMKGLPFACY